MRKQIDEFIKLKPKDMGKAMSDITYKYINPDTNQPTKVPPSHYEKALEQIVENYTGEIASKQFLVIMYNQLNALKKEDEKYFQQALLCIDMGINPKDLRIDEQIAISFTHNYIEDKQRMEKKNFHLLNKDIVDTYNVAKENPRIQAQAIERSNEYEKREFEEIDYEM